MLAERVVEKLDVICGGLLGVTGGILAGRQNIMITFQKVSIVGCGGKRADPRINHDLGGRAGTGSSTAKRRLDGGGLQNSTVHPTLRHPRAG